MKKTQTSSRAEILDGFEFPLPVFPREKRREAKSGSGFVDRRPNKMRNRKEVPGLIEE